MLNKTSESKTSLLKELTNFSYSSSYKDSHKNSIIDIKQKYSGTNINRSNDYNSMYMLIKETFYVHLTKT